MTRDYIEQKIKALSDSDAPDGMHERIMNKISRAQFRAPFLVILSLLILNLAFSAWRVWMRIIQLESLSIFRALMDGFAFTSDFIQDFASAAPQFLPLSSLTMFLINLMLVSFGIRFYLGIRRVKLE